MRCLWRVLRAWRPRGAETSPTPPPPDWPPHRPSFISGKCLHDTTGGGCAALSPGPGEPRGECCRSCRGPASSRGLCAPVRPRVHAWTPARLTCTVECSNLELCFMMFLLFINAPSKASQARPSSQLTCLYHRKLYQLHNVLKGYAMSM